MTLGSLFSLSEPLLPYLCNGDMSPCLETLLWVRKELLPLED